MSREYVSVVGSAKPISPADLQKSAQWPNSLLATFDGTTPGSSLASTFQSNIIFLSGFPDQCLLDTKTFHAWIPHFLPLASAIVAHYSNESIDSALLSSWLQRDRPLIHKYHKGFGLIIQLPRERWFGPDGHLNVHDPAPDGLPMIPIFHVPPPKPTKAITALSVLGHTPFRLFAAPTPIFSAKTPPWELSECFRATSFMRAPS